MVDYLWITLVHNITKEAVIMLCDEVHAKVRPVAIDVLGYLEEDYDEKEETSSLRKLEGVTLIRKLEECFEVSIFDNLRWWERCVKTFLTFQISLWCCSARRSFLRPDL